ncbi:hypothetical protein B1C78_11500 [Thioalkalivibrio denitrificans]|uniref:VWFA domain-containing protein n=1 Tax=Thioalkalivibrio denitrificans TaxID=108003 RepID=A0A1V3NF11_9GAMM|nr:VWA domain-containing protein [Thioalkalivibrio denitrificans]OOG23366.1 hypothetical protein B1C78_11500 [Thioalkalivibrio denitrificans]
MSLSTLVPPLLWQLEWRTPPWLALALLPWCLLALSRWRDRPLLRYADAALRPWALERPGHRGALRFAAVALAWLLLAAALAGPRIPMTVEAAGQGHRSDLSLMLVLDVSRTMLAEDVTPRRLQRAMLETDALLEHLQGERVGVVAVSGRPLLLTPPTTDRDVLRHYLERAPGVMSDLSGKALAGGLRLAREAMTGEAGAVVLITDGDSRALAEPHRTDLLAEASRLREAGLALYVLGVGGAEAVAVPAPGGGLLREGGEAVLSRMDVRALEQLAGTGGGRYAAAGTVGARWDRLYTAGIARIPSATQVHQWRDLYGWLLAPALVLLLLSWYRPGPGAVPAVLLGALLIPVYSGPAHADASRHEARAHAAYTAGDYHAALHAYVRLGGFAGRMGEGASAYRLGDHAHAAEAFTRALLEAPGDRERAEALFNLGNARFRQGEMAAAVEAYRGALAYPSPHGERILHNLARAASRAPDPADAGLAGRRTRQATEDVGRMDLEETPDFPEDEGPSDAVAEEGERDALGEAVARGERMPEGTGAAGRPGVVLDVSREYDAALMKLDRLEDRDLRLLRALRDREAPRDLESGR